MEARWGYVFGVSVGVGTWLFMLKDLECKTASYRKTLEKERISLLPVNRHGAWVVIAPTSDRPPKSAYFQPFLMSDVEEQGGLQRTTEVGI